MYKNELLTESQNTFRSQKSKIDAAMEENIIETELEKLIIFVMTASDDKGSFNAAWWPSILKSLKDAECPRNLYFLTKGHFIQRTAALNTNNISIERRVTKGCPQGSCCGPRFWNLLYNSIFILQFTSHTKVIAFADDLIILTK